MEKKKCENCKKQLKRSNYKHLSLPQFMRLKFCNKKCCDEHNYKKFKSIDIYKNA